MELAELVQLVDFENMSLSNSISQSFKKNSGIHKLSIAPMLDITNSHYRNMMRLITRETLLYTEMIHHDTILYSKGGIEYELDFDEVEKPLIIQLGGNQPETLEKIAGLCKDYNYDEINLNCGCPSTKVQNANFGACLMRQPEVVADITNRMRAASNLEVSVKCRLGLNSFDGEFLNNFISEVSSKGGVNHFIMHARLAMMNLDTDKNRKIPPLQYDTVKGLKQTFPNLNFSLNGGIKTLDEIENLLNCEEYHGVMIGRAAYDNPWIFADVDRRFFNKPNLNLSRKEIVYKYSDYCEKTMLEDPAVHYNHLIKPLTYLFNGEKYNNSFKNQLYTYKKSDLSIGDHIKTTLEEYEKINFEAVNKLPKHD
jgi:tRNA-dihydrouridine synthase A